MNIRHLSFAKPIISSLVNYITKNNGITFVIFLFLCSAIISNLLFNRNFTAQAHNSENETSESGSSPLANLNLVIRIGQDGLAPLNTTADRLNDRAICPSNPTAGCDFGYHNGIARTNDQIVYTYDYTVNGGNEDITVIASAPFPGTAWDFLPAFCYGANDPNPGDPASTITGDGITSPSVITCRRRMKASGTAESLPFTATVMGDQLNGAVLNASGAVSGPNSPMVFAGAPNVTVSAAPRFNLRKSYAGRSSLTTVDGISGYILFYVADIEVRDTDSVPAALNPRYGSSVLSSPITFTDDVSGISPNAKLNGCQVINDYGGNAGTISPPCSQSADGQPISVTIAGADTSLKQYSSPPSNNRFSIGAYFIRVFIPATDVPPYPGSRSTINVLTNFDPTSPTGQSNFDTDSANPFENLDDNGVSANISHDAPQTPGDGIFRKNFLRDDNATLSTDTLVAPGGNIKAQVLFVNDSAAPFNNVVLCDVIDKTKYNVFGTSAADIIDTSGAQTPTVQFAAGYVDSGWLPTVPGDINDIRRECGDPSVDWQPITTFLPGNLASITKFRVVYNDPVAVNDSVSVRVRMQVRDTYNNLLIPAGAPLANLGAVRHGGVSDYIKNTFARLILARATVRITKETENNNTANSIETANSNGIGFVLKPTISTIPITGPATPAQQVTVVDVLPFGLKYKPFSAQQTGNSNPEPAQTLCGVSSPYPACIDPNQWVLTWILDPNRTPDTPIAPITFRVTADLTVFNNEVLTNTTIISSPADPSQISLRTATRNIIGASPSTFLIYKETDTPQIDVNGNFSYKVTYTNRSFITDFSGMDFIDVLPSNNDGTLPFGSGAHLRTPPTNYNPGGSRRLAGVAPTGVTTVWYFTNSTPINISPKHSGNLNPGTLGSIWCAGNLATLMTDCGYQPSQVTAVRMRDTTVMLRDNTIRSFTLNFTSNNNQAGDIYTNNSSGAVSEIVLPVSSINVPVVVVSGSISGTVWYDTDGDGIRNSLETGKVNRSLVTLTGTTTGGAPVNQTKNTGPSGNYSFDGLSSGTYTVKFTRPLNYRASSKGSDSDGDPITLITDALSVGATTVDQGFYQLNLGGTVWHDTIKDGKLIGENPIPNIDVQLLSNGIPLQKDQTAADGTYSFVNLEAGDYQVVIDPNGINATSVFFPNPNDNVDNDNNGMPQAGLIISNPITLAAGTEPTINNANGKTNNNTLDFGLILSPTAASVALGGRIVASDGRGIVKAIVTMTGANGSVHTAITNPFGYYRFDDVPVGMTVIISVSAKNYTFEISTQVISVTEKLAEINFVSNN